MKISRALSYFIMTVGTILAFEFFSYLIMTNVSPLPGSFTDEFLKTVHGEDWLDYKTVRIEETQSVVYSPFVEYIERPRSGRFVNVNSDGIRHAPQDALKTPSSEIWVFGGSTTFGYGVKDRETIPHFLGENVSSQGHRPEYDVLNFGSASYYSTVERIRFLNLLNEGHKPAAAIFLDGLNDFFYFQSPDQSAFSKNIDLALSEKFHYHFKKLISFTWSKKFVKYLSTRFPISRNSAGRKQRPSANRITPEILLAAARLHRNRVILARSYQALDIICIFVQQPVPTYGYDHSDNSKVPKDWLEMNLGHHTNSGLGYGFMASQLDVYRKDLGASLLWLADESIPEPMYIDTVHYSPEFSRYLAGKIHEHLITLLPEGS